MEFRYFPGFGDPEAPFGHPLGGRGRQCSFFLVTFHEKWKKTQTDDSFTVLMYFRARGSIKTTTGLEKYARKSSRELIGKSIVGKTENTKTNAPF